MTTHTANGHGDSAVLTQTENTINVLMSELDKTGEDSARVESFHRDALAFVADILNDPHMGAERKLSLIAGTIIHDLSGVIHHASCFHSGVFVPRCNGWSANLAA